MEGSTATAMDTLSRREEDTLLKATKARALKDCDDLVKNFAACATSRTVSVVWACRAQHKELQACMYKQYVPTLGNLPVLTSYTIVQVLRTWRDSVPNTCGYDGSPQNHNRLCPRPMPMSSTLATRISFEQFNHQHLPTGQIRRSSSDVKRQESYKRNNYSPRRGICRQYPVQAYRGL
ncbi:hypothetical protein FRC10_005170 [Ceratobasidium sp. 414]|nr:hypothetical protein FRC10_005170 [Ceratobasidium sp. 414]